MTEEYYVILEYQNLITRTMLNTSCAKFCFKKNKAPNILFCIITLSISDFLYEEKRMYWIPQTLQLCAAQKHVPHRQSVVLSD